MYRTLLISCALSLACGSEASPTEQPEPGHATLQPPDPTRHPNPEAAAPVTVSSEFCQAYLTLRDQEREFGSEDVSPEDVDDVVTGLRALAEDAPEELAPALLATADIYHAERLRLVNNLIGLILMERRSFDDERDLLLQMNAVGDFMARSNCEMSDINIAGMVAEDEAAIPAETPEESPAPGGVDPIESTED